MCDPCNEELMEAVRKTGCKTSFEFLYYRNRVQARRYLVAYAWGRHMHLLDDMVQCAFLRLFRYRQPSKRIDSFWPWFYTILSRSAIDILRVENRELEGRELRDFSTIPHVSEPADHRMINSLDGLSDEKRRWLIAIYVEGKSISELARELGKNRKTLHRYIQKAIESLRNQIVA